MGQSQSGYSGVSPSVLNAAIASLSAQIPTPSTSVPPNVTAAAGVIGSIPGSFALPDHSHASSVQRATLTTQVANGKSTVTWTFPRPYATTPVVQATAQNLSGGPQPYLVEITAVGATSVTATLWQAQQQTLGATLAAIIGFVISPFIPGPAGVSINLLAASPT